MNEFVDQVAVVTGAGGGIGLELARVFAEQGCRLVLADIEEAPLQAAGQALGGLGVEVLTVTCDVGDADSVEYLATTAEKRFGAIHIVCNNAGVFVGGHLWEATMDDYDWLIRVNQYGVINGIRSFIPRMLEHGNDCHMINTASMAAVTSMPYSGIYHMTKHAVLALSESLYHELSLSAPQAGVSCLCPELFNTGIGTSARNRPTSPGPVPASETRAWIERAIIDSTARGKHPRELAERVLQAVIDRQFYILSDDSWRDAANSRLDDIREGRNPTLCAPEV